MSALYMAVTPDKYELPFDLDKSARELSRRLGLVETTVSVSISKNIKQTKLPDGRKARFYKVDIDESEDK